MANVELVIRIPKEEYELCKKHKGHLGDHKMISDAIANGTPLPKGHGGLIDVKDLIKRIRKYIDSPDKYISQRNKDFIYYLETEEPVIEADTEE